MLQDRALPPEPFVVSKMTRAEMIVSALLEDEAAGDWLGKIARLLGGTAEPPSFYSGGRTPKKGGRLEKLRKRRDPEGVEAAKAEELRSRSSTA